MLSMLSLISVYLLDLYLNVICLNVSPIRLLGLLGTSVFFQIWVKVRVMVFNSTFNSTSVI